MAKIVALLKSNEKMNWYKMDDNMEHLEISGKLTKEEREEILNDFLRGNPGKKKVITKKYKDKYSGFLVIKAKEVTDKELDPVPV